MNSTKNYVFNQIKVLIQYYDLGYILNNIESLITLPTPYKTSQMSKKQFENNKRLSINSHINAQTMYDNLVNETQLRKLTFENIRKIYPDFCQNMRTKCSNEEYNEYLDLLKSCSREISKIITSFKDRATDYENLLMDKKDYISSIIDSENNSRLTFLQDKFVLSELELIDLSIMDSKTQDNIETIKADLNKRIDNYYVFQKLYSSKNVIKLKNKKAATDKERE